MLTRKSLVRWEELLAARPGSSRRSSSSGQRRARTGPDASLVCWSRAGQCDGSGELPSSARSLAPSPVGAGSLAKTWATCALASTEKRGTSESRSAFAATLVASKDNSCETAMGSSRRRGFAGPSMARSGARDGSEDAQSSACRPFARPFFNRQGRYRNRFHKSSDGSWRRDEQLDHVTSMRHTLQPVSIVARGTRCHYRAQVFMPRMGTLPHRGWAPAARSD